MKTIPYVLLIILLGGTAIAETSSQGEGTVLCRMLASSLSNPWKFDAVVTAESKYFDSKMSRYIQGELNKLTAEAKAREAICEPYKNKSMGYDQCIGSNTAATLASWLESILQAAEGTAWNQTDFGSGQLKIWNACNNPAFCQQLRSSAAIEAQQDCPLWFGS
ncbi:hypothetical protein [Kaarinaea lacus]